MDNNENECQTQLLWWVAEVERPKDYGSVQVVGLVSVIIYTIALCSLGFF